MDMFDEVRQLVALAKNDEQYFKRIEALKDKQLELAHVLEIAKTLGEADMHLAQARQEAAEIIEKANKEAEEIKGKAESIVADTKATLEKNKAKAVALKEKEVNLEAQGIANKQLEKELEKAIKDHRDLTAARSEEQEAARKVKLEFTEKLRKLKEVANT